MNNTQDTLAELRHNYFDGSEGFMTGHQIIKIRQSGRKTPEWAINNKKVQEVLLRAFPKLKTDLKQRAKAARWALFIQLYFRAHMTEKQMADRMNMTRNGIKMLARNIRRIAAGKKSYGTRTKSRKRQ
jgi:hypothetical protein